MSQTFVPLDQLLVDLPHSPGTPVFWTPSSHVDPGEFLTRVSGLSERLADGPDRWVLVCEDGYAFTVGLLAVWHSGGVAVMPPNPKPGMVSDSMEPGDGLLTDRGELADVAEPLDPLGHEGSPGKLGRMDPKRVSTVVMTSGSTGERKTLPKRLKNLTPGLRNFETVWGDRLEESTVVATVSHQHAFGLFYKILWPLCSGSPILPGQPTFPEDIKRNVLGADPAHLLTSPAPLKRLVRSGEVPAMAHALKGVYSGGGVLEAETVRGLNEALDVPPVSVYGSTEAGGMARRERPSADEIPPWDPFPGVEHRISPEGELEVRSPEVGDPLPEWYPTGDLAEAAAEGGFFLRGRRDRTVKVAEKSISLPEIEEHLSNSPLVRSASVLVVNEDDPDRRRTELGAAVILTEEGERTRAEADEPLEDTLRAALEPYCERVALPRHWLFLETFPRDHMSKIQRDELRNRFGNGNPER